MAAFCGAATSLGVTPNCIDDAVISAIQENGLQRSQVRATTAVLIDGIRLRLTGALAWTGRNPG